MTDANNMRNYLDLLGEKSGIVPHTGALDNGNAEYAAVQKGDGEITKVMVHLKRYDSGRYTKLGRNLQRLERINARVAAIKEEVKQDTRELIADLFHAEDACRTRMVETVGFIFQLTKDPKATVTPQYKKVLEELTNHMTPELIAMMEDLKSKYQSTTQKPPALTARDKSAIADESIEEGIGDFWKKLKNYCRKYLRHVQEWGKDYDARLDALKAQVAMAEGSDLNARFSGSELEEAPKAGFLDTGRGDADIKWGQILTKGIEKLITVPKKAKKKYKWESVDEAEDENYTPTWQNPIIYRGYEIYANEQDYKIPGDEYAFHVAGWEPGDPDGETGVRDSSGFYTASSIQDAKDMIDDAFFIAEPVSEDGDWHDQDDLQAYNDAEADDYRNEGGDDDEDPFHDVDKYSAEEAVTKAAEMLGLPVSGETADPKDVAMAQRLYHELRQYGDVYMLVPTENDSAYEFHIADADNVNSNFGAMATCWVENGFYWES